MEVKIPRSCPTKVDNGKCKYAHVSNGQGCVKWVTCSKIYFRWTPSFARSVSAQPDIQILTAIDLARPIS